MIDRTAEGTPGRDYPIAPDYPNCVICHQAILPHQTRGRLWETFTEYEQVIPDMYDIHYPPNVHLACVPDDTGDLFLENMDLPILPYLPFQDEPDEDLAYGHPEAIPDETDPNYILGMQQLHDRVQSILGTPIDGNTVDQKRAEVLAPDWELAKDQAEYMNIGTRYRVSVFTQYAGLRIPVLVCTFDDILQDIIPPAGAEVRYTYCWLHGAKTYGKQDSYIWIAKELPGRVR